MECVCQSALWQCSHRGGIPWALHSYLSRTCFGKIAITTHRILAITEGGISFKYKDYADGSKQKQMALSHAEFLRRFEQHILPRRFVKIRHYGLLQNHGKTRRLSAIRKQLKLNPLPVKVTIPVSQRRLEKYGRDITLCPACHKGRLVLISITYQVSCSNIPLQQNNRQVKQNLISNTPP